MSMQLRKSTSLALGALLVSGLSTPALAMTDLAQGYALGAATAGQSPPPAQQDTAGNGASSETATKQKAEGKCGEGKCGGKHAGDKAKTAPASKVKDGKQHAEGKCGEGKCGSHG